MERRSRNMLIIIINIIIITTQAEGNHTNFVQVVYTDIIPLITARSNMNIDP